MSSRKVKLNLKKRIVDPLLISFTVIASVLIVFGTHGLIPVLEQFDQVVLNLRFRVRNEVFSRNKTPSTDLVLLAINDTLYKEYGEGNGKSVSRLLWADLVDFLSRSGARVINFDVLFDSPNLNDKQFATAIKEAQKRGTIVNLAGGQKMNTAVFSLQVKGKASSDIVLTGNPEQQLLLPNDTLMSTDPGIGLSNTSNKLSYRVYEEAIAEIGGIQLDESDSKDTENFVSKRYFSQATLVYKELNSLPDSFNPEEHGINIQSSITEPHEGSDYTLTDYKFLVNYRLSEGAFNTINISDIYSWFGDKEISVATPGEISEELIASREQYESMLADNGKTAIDKYQDKIVFIGSIDRADNDYFITPMGSMSGVETNMWALNTLINRDYLYVISEGIELGILILLTLIVTWIASTRATLVGIISFLVIESGFVICYFYLFIEHNLVGNVLQTFTSVFLSFFAVVYYKYNQEQQEKQKIRNTFSRYMSSELVGQLVENPDLAKPGGEKKRVAVFFSDIRSYSTITENMSPEDAIEFLNIYLNSMMEIILRNRGFVDKIMGDGIMAVFGAPIDSDNPCDDAVKSSIEMIENLHKHIYPLLAKRQPPFPQIKIGVGIHYGEVVMGNVGSSNRVDYTCIGDTVNLASRLESETKNFHTAIIVSEEVVNHLSIAVDKEYIDSIHVKGRKSEVEVYKIYQTEQPELFVI